MRGGLILALLALAMATLPAAAGDREDCFAGKDDQRRIAACSALIAGEPANANLYHHRGLAFHVKGDYERAIADFGKAAELKPGYAPVYESRARTYAAKGEYVQAIADSAKAVELTPKPVAKTAKAAPAVPHKVKVAAKARPRIRTKTVDPFNDWFDWTPKAQAPE
jgi:tetratricopeptide (TPR) repeat protein